MGFNCGILGLPNVGKSTLFNALTSSQIADSQNYPFCTIEPNIGKVVVPDNRLSDISQISKSQKTIYNQLEFVDIAGLVKGASKGEGLGNKFLSNLGNVDALIHVVRCFEDSNITHVDNKIDPLNDIKTIETELLLSDLSKVENILNNLIKKNKGQKIDKILESTLGYIKKNLNDGKLINELNFDNEQKKIIEDYNFITYKPFLFVCNVDENSLQNGNDFSKIVEDYALEKKFENLLISASIESEISQINDMVEKKEFLKELGVTETSLSKLIKKGYKLLDLITFFTSGEKESKAWSIIKGTLAPEAGSKIHTDFQRGFIKAETISFEDFINYKGEFFCKEAGKVRQEGKDYLVQDGDIITFKFNV